MGSQIIMSQYDGRSISQLFIDSRIVEFFIDSVELKLQECNFNNACDKILRSNIFWLPRLRSRPKRPLVIQFQMKFTTDQTNPD